jgi:hypothetical protein
MKSHGPGATDPTGRRERALDAFLEAKQRDGFDVETRTGTHAIIVERKSLLVPFRRRRRYVLSVDERGGNVTMMPAEPKRS